MSTLLTTLVLGGARAGKSSFAERFVRSGSLERVYVATATAGDAEMRERIAHHRASRDDGWRTIETPVALIDALARESAPDRAVLVDCLTLWLSNLMQAGCDTDAESRRLADFLQRAPGPVILVSNEIGLGLVPDTPLGRRFRDAQGRLNHVVADAVPAVAFVAAGLPLWLKHPKLEIFSP
jgi:adenosylcobinamide kinase/adenosylcobinamide-phosphate guanylyltransferase